MAHQIRKAIQKDLAQLKLVLDSSELFPSKMLDDMISDYFNNEESEDIWFTAVDNDLAISIGYCAPEKLTEGTYNLYAIALHKDFQGKGVGGEMMTYIEQELIKKQARLLIVETSGTPEYELTRKFYLKYGYTQEATIRDFYTEGDDKVVFCKKLN